MLSLTYVSSARSLLSVPELVELLTSIRPKNDALELTGLLLYSDGNIIQTLEGPDTSVETVFASIARDPRHTGIIVLLREKAEERAFPEWSMGFRNLGEHEIDDIRGYTDFARRTIGHGLGKQTSSAYRLLELFQRNLG